MLEQSLSQLINAQLIRPLVQEERAFLFKHALTQEAAYESLLLKTRRELHARVARAYEQQYADHLDEYAALLAHHYDQAGDVNKTLEYSRRAGDADSRVNANLAAIAHYGRAIEMAHLLLETGPQPAASIEETLRQLYLRRGRLFELNSRYDLAIANYEQMEAEGKQRGEAGLALAGLMEHAKLLSTPNPQWDWARGMKLANEALVLSRDLQDRPAQARLLWILLLSHYYGAVDLEQAARYGQESLALSRELGLRQELAFVLNDLGGIYQERGEIRYSLSILAEAESLWRELNNMPMLTDSLANAATDHFYLGEFETALRISEQGFQIGQAIDNEWAQSNSRIYAGQALMELGRWGQAIEIMDLTIQQGDRSGHPGIPIAVRCQLAWALCEMGSADQALPIARLAVERGDHLPPFRPFGQAALARVYLLRGDLRAAETTLDQAESTLLLHGSSLSPVYVMLARAELALAQQSYDSLFAAAGRLLEHLKRTETRVFAYDALFFRAQALLGNGQPGAADEVLKQAEAQAQAMGAHRSLWRILIARSRLETSRGRSEEALALRARAREILHELLASLHQPELRRSIEQLSEVRDVLGDDAGTGSR